jgi:hypothetical protein
MRPARSPGCSGAGRDPDGGRARRTALSLRGKGPPDRFLGDLHEQVKGWLGINF